MSLIVFQQLQKLRESQQRRAEQALRTCVDLQEQASRDVAQARSQHQAATWGLASEEQHWLAVRRQSKAFEQDDCLAHEAQMRRCRRQVDQAEAELVRKLQVHTDATAAVTEARALLAERNRALAKAEQGVQRQQALQASRLALAEEDQADELGAQSAGRGAGPNGACSSWGLP